MFLLKLFSKLKKHHKPRTAPIIVAIILSGHLSAIPPVYILALGSKASCQLFDFVANIDRRARPTKMQVSALSLIPLNANWHLRQLEFFPSIYGNSLRTPTSRSWTHTINCKKVRVCLKAWRTTETCLWGLVYVRSKLGVYPAARSMEGAFDKARNACSLGSEAQDYLGKGWKDQEGEGYAGR